MDIERPLDFLNDSKEERVMAELKSGRRVGGTLKAFDVHLNIVLSNAEEMEDGKTKKKLGNIFIRGDTIVIVSPSNSNKV